MSNQNKHKEQNKGQDVRNVVSLSSYLILWLQFCRIHVEDALCKENEQI